MNYEAAILIAKQRMREIGYSEEQYHFDFITVTGTEDELKQGYITIKAFNEYYYLIHYQNYYGLQILSDTGFFDADDIFQNTIQEYTGVIRIIRTSKTWNLGQGWNNNKEYFLTTERPVEFLRVTLH